MDKCVQIQQEYKNETLKHIYLTIKGISAYPLNHPSINKLVGKSYQMIQHTLKTKKFITATAIGETLLFDDIPINYKKIFAAGFASFLSKRNVDSLTFFRGLSINDFKTFLIILAERSDNLKTRGGVANEIRKRGISHIKVNEIKYGKITDDKQGGQTDAILNLLNGEIDCLNGGREYFFDLIEKEPKKITELINFVIENTEINENSYSLAAQARITTDTIKRITAELLKKKDLNLKSFKNLMNPILSSFDRETLVRIAQSMTVIENDSQ